MAFDFNHFKEQYEVLAKQYSLPDFAELNDDFELERISQESAAVLRVVRKTMMDKISNTLSFFDMLLSTVNAPRLYLPYIKVMSFDDRKTIEKIYGSFGAISLKSLILEVDYSEKGEAEMIDEIYKCWKSMKPSLKTLMKHISEPVTSVGRKEKSYFG